MRRPPRWRRAEVGCGWLGWLVSGLDGAQEPGNDDRGCTVEHLASPPKRVPTMQALFAKVDTSRLFT